MSTPFFKRYKNTPWYMVRKVLLDDSPRYEPGKHKKRAKGLRITLSRYDRARALRRRWSSFCPGKYDQTLDRMCSK